MNPRPAYTHASYSADLRRLRTYSRLGAVKAIGCKRISEEMRDKSQGAARVREMLSRPIADRLEALGLPGYRAGSGLTCWGVVSGEEDTKGNGFANCNLIPAVQHLNMAEHRAALGAYLQKHEKGQYARYLVVTGGERVHRSKIRERFKVMNRRLSRFIVEAAELFPWAEFVCRANETTLGSDAFAHPHMNLIVILKAYVSKKKFNEFQAALREAMRGWCRDAGRINDVNEVIKYTFKYSSAITEKDALEAAVKSNSKDCGHSVQGLLQLKPEPGEKDPVGTLYHQLYKMRLFTAFGEFASFRRKYKGARLLPRKIGERFDFVRRAKYQPKIKGGGGSVENKLVSVCMPRPLGEKGCLIEPSLAISNLNWTPKTAEGAANLKTLIQARAMVVSVLGADWQRQSGVEISDEARSADLTVEEFDAPETPKGIVVYLQHRHDNCRKGDAKGEAHGEAKPSGEAQTAKIQSLAGWLRDRKAKIAQDAAAKWNAEGAAMAEAARLAALARREALQT